MLMLWHRADLCHGVEFQITWALSRTLLGLETNVSNLCRRVQLPYVTKVK